MNSSLQFLVIEEAPTVRVKHMPGPIPDDADRLSRRIFIAANHTTAASPCASLRKTTFATP